jgi:hypothetical protein
MEKLSWVNPRENATRHRLIRVRDIKRMGERAQHGRGAAI